MTDTLPKDFCPYKGLQPYTETDRAFFFGRGRDSEIIASNLYASPLTVLYGESGVGKSSVLLAGVIPLLHQTPNVAVVVFRQWQDARFGEMLRREILRAVGEATGREEKVNLDQPLDDFLVECGRILQGPIFFIFDQFEEFFLYHPQTDGAQGFDAEWARAVNRQDVDANFLLSLREDSLSRLDRFRGRIPKLLGNMLRLKHLDKEAGRAAIRKPLEKYNQLSGDTAAHVDVEERLVETLLEEIAAGRVTLGAGRGQVNTLGADREVQDERIETPFLQMVLTRLWDEEQAEGSRTLRLATLYKLGGAERIIRTHLDKAMQEKLTPEQQDVAARLFRFLVTPSGTKIAHTTNDLSAYAELPPEQVESVLKVLGTPEVRILRPIAPPPGQEQGYRYEIFHDVLAQAILDWRTRYVQEKKRLSEEKERAEERAEADRRLASEKRRTRLLRYAFAGSFIIIVVATWFLILFYRQRSQLKNSQIEAYARELAAYSYAEEDRNPDLSLLLAIEAARVRLTHQVVDALKGALAMQRTQFQLKAGEGAIRGIAYSPDNKYIATAHWDKNTVHIWNAKTGDNINVLNKHTGPLTNVTFSHDGQYLLTVSQDKTARIWERWQTPDPHLLVTITEKNPLWGAAFSPDDRYLVVSGDHTLRIYEWKTEEGPQLRKDLSHRGVLFTVAFSPDGRYVAGVGSNSTELAIWEWEKDESLEPGAENPIRIETPGKIFTITFSPDGKYLAAACGDRMARVWDWTDRSKRQNPLQLTQPGAAVVRGVAFSPDGKYLASTSEDGVVRLWEWQTDAGRTQPLELRGHVSYVYCAAFSGDGFLATGGEDQTARVWRTEGIDPDKLPNDPNTLLRMAMERRTRPMTQEERERYLSEDHEKFIEQEAKK
jgi:hypothetical protein